MIMPGKRTWSMWFHIFGHEQALAQQKAQEQAMQQAQMAKDSGMVDKGQAQSGKLKVGAEKRSPTAAASPIQTEMNPSNNLIKNNQQ